MQGKINKKYYCNKQNMKINILINVKSNKSFKNSIFKIKNNQITMNKKL